MNSTEERSVEEIAQEIHQRYGGGKYRDAQWQMQHDIAAALQAERARAEKAEREIAIASNSIRDFQEELAMANARIRDLEDERDGYEVTLKAQTDHLNDLRKRVVEVLKPLADVVHNPIAKHCVAVMVEIGPLWAAAALHHQLSEPDIPPMGGMHGMCCGEVSEVKKQGAH